ncbi:AraC family transcriptional regulator [Paenibacillus sp. GD4]|jgi:AraC family transcriptional regulator, arabinose operon regulatory protein|uniref:AraC family transcriptional regulator n=1 Tax=Paenibacillus TaxID=44249 RepID=UPI002543AE73|nr:MULTISPECIES: AraC family transcriptional regulator [Paenibacillus]MDQ1912653.1 AraC family transcriptional regulator [Paenibacillus sp. GD4]
MNDLIEKKYMIGDGSFAIQRMRRYGFSAMQRPHSHSFYELYCLLEGERVYFMNGKVHTAQKGDIVIVVPHDLHSTASSQVEQFERVLIHFTPEFLHEADGDILRMNPFLESTLLRIPPKEQPELERLLLQMVGECKEEQPLHDAYVRHLLLELLIRLHRINADIPVSPAPSHPMHQKVSEITAYIQTNYREALTLEQLAKQFFISPAYLSRIFLKLTGFHISEYIRVVRIREAQKLLRTTRQKVHAVAEQVGFEHISHFNKTFKKVTGVSPLHYRQDHRY